MCERVATISMRIWFGGAFLSVYNIYVVSGTTPPGAQGSAVCRLHHHHYHHYEMQCQTESSNCDRSPVILCRCIRLLRSCADPP